MGEITVLDSETLYVKRGRKYVPVYSRRDGWNDSSDLMRVGTCRLTYAYGDGGRRYEYDVTPDTAGFVAACTIARHAMEQAITEAAKVKPHEKFRPYTKREREIIAQFQQDMGMVYPQWWSEGSAHDISRAAIEAVKNFGEVEK